MMVPLDVVAAYDLAVDGEYKQAAARSASAANGAVGTYAAAVGSKILARASLLAAPPMTVLMANLELNPVFDALEKKSKDLAEMRRLPGGVAIRRFDPAINAAFTQYYKDHFGGSPHDSRDKNGKPCPPGMRVQPHELPLPKPFEYFGLGTFVGMKGVQDHTPAGLENEMLKQRAKSQGLIQQALNNPLTQTYTRPFFAGLERKEISELMKTVEDRVQLQGKIEAARRLDIGLDNSTAEYDQLLKDIKTIEDNEILIKTIDQAMIELKGEKDGVFTFGGNKIPSYKSRYEEIEKIRLEYAAEQER
ncbi:MAG: hypothetical protein K2Q01_11095, partial [Rickettsiales bacterium]|nr:hypothetical protein [Rickettsiales bacterium]